ncbi:MAG TPA: prepilin-type N-terminal cleavage/methylation domain-containing protein [Candidatus Paceibacterota bacterium]|nr:prepilin-type N-terminal cleavage/methylation domain-containing protein [Candidatus Paceibacterota bacterium]
METGPNTRLTGFTLLEILLVVAAISILAGIVIVAINPGEQLGQTRNAQRRADVRTISDAIAQYYLKEGTYPTTFETGTTCGNADEQEICKTGASPCYTDLSELTTNATYLVSIPVDPLAESTGSGYYVVRNTTTNRVIVCAPLAELSETISVTR